MFVWALAVALIGGVAAAQDKEKDKKEEPRKGTVTGEVTAKGDNWIEVKGDGEEKARRYVPHWVGGNPSQGGGPDKKMVETIKGLKVGSRVRVEWEFEERPRVVKVEVLKAPEDKDEPRKGTVAGTLTAKDKNWIEVKADGEEKARRYTPYWRGGNPNQGGGLDKEMLKVFADLKVGSRVRLEWEFDERPRAVKVEVLDKPKKEKN